MDQNSNEFTNLVNHYYYVHKQDNYWYVSVYHYDNTVKTVDYTTQKYRESDTPPDTSQDEAIEDAARWMNERNICALRVC